MKINNNIIIPCLCLCLSLISSCLSLTTPKCLQNQTSILLVFKNEFSLDDFDEYTNPKTENWSSEIDCCLWDGVECDGAGNVVGLDLSSGSLLGSLVSESSLFGLTHLRRLNLAYNNFNYSTIPSRLGSDLPRLTHLNLSKSMFSGRIPNEISWLKDLVSLDLSSMNYTDHQLLALEKEVVTGLIRNVSGLRELNLNAVNLSSSEAEVFGNLSSLETLSLSETNLSGEFPKRIFQMPDIRVIYVPSNPRLTGSLPEFPPESKLESLVLSSTKFSGILSSSIGNLKYLTVLELGGCGFSGTVGASLGNLSRLTVLDLSKNNFSGEVPSSLGGLGNLEKLLLSKNQFSGAIPSRLGNLTRLTDLKLSNNRFTGGFPVALANLTGLSLFEISNNLLYGSVQIPSSASLSTLSLSHNLFNGTIPSSLFEMPSLSMLTLDFNKFSGSLTVRNVSSTQLSYLNVRRNMLSGKIPSSISNLTGLIELSLGANEFSGVFEFGTLSNLSSLENLELSYNNISITFQDTNSTVPSFTSLGLASCNLIEFPKFLRNQTELWQLDLSKNNIKGKIPKWFTISTGLDSLAFLHLASNFITGWEQEPSVLPWNNLDYLGLQENRLQGSLILPQPSLKYYFFSNNSLAGEIDQSFCELHNLKVLDVSDNRLSGDIPPCLGLNGSLLMLNLRGNNFRGEVPKTCSEGSALQTIDFSHNKLQGSVPNSFVNCKELEVLNIGYNHISDEFPFWTQSLPKLKVLVLRNNKFNGPIWHPRKFFGFENLQIVDVSYNNFSGSLPWDYFRNWSAINSEIPNENKTLNYLGNPDNYYRNSMTLENKGTSMHFVKILTTLMSIDLSNNQFLGEIPGSVGDLKSLIVLNLSSNGFIGVIPSSLQHLTELQSLDLSKNELSGEIPRELARLTFLSYLNLSENNLHGRIPAGPQLDTFSNFSYVGNADLCGVPLTKKCETERGQESQSELESESESWFDWKAMLIGCGGGLLIGLIIEHFVGSRRPNWFPRIYLRVKY